MFGLGIRSQARLPRVQEEDPLTLVRRIAALAQLELDPTREEHLAREFTALLEHFHALQDVDVSGVEPTLGATEVADVFRDDRVAPSVEPDRLLGNAPDRRDDYYGVPKTIGGTS